MTVLWPSLFLAVVTLDALILRRLRLAHPQEWLGAGSPRFLTYINPLRANETAGPVRAAIHSACSEDALLRRLRQSYLMLSVAHLVAFVSFVVLWARH